MNYSIHTFQLTLYLESEGRYLQHKSKLSKGIRIVENENKRGRSLNLIINPSKVLYGDDLVLWVPTNKNISKLLKKLNQRISDYFDSEYELDDFELTRIDFTVDFNVGSKKRVAAYIQVLHNIGKVTGFKMKFDENDFENGVKKDCSFDLISSSGFEFSEYDKWKECGRDETEGILRAEVRLIKRKAIHKYAKKAVASEQISELAKKSKKIFLETFTRIVHLGNYYNMKQASRIINENVSKVKQREKMLRLLKLAKKKTLHEAKKEMSDKNFDRIMRKFAEINLSPVTIRKRYGVRELKSLYSYLVE